MRAEKLEFGQGEWTVIGGLFVEWLGVFGCIIMNRIR